LGKRLSNVISIQKAAKAVMEKSDEDTTHLQAQLIDLTTKWDRVCIMSTDKRQRLDEALVEVYFYISYHIVVTHVNVTFIFVYRFVGVKRTGNY